MRDFLWPNNGSTKGLHWVNWGEVCCLKHQGGLGIRPLCQMNEVSRSNGFGDLLKRRRHCGERWLSLSMGLII